MDVAKYPLNTLLDTLTADYADASSARSELIVVAALGENSRLIALFAAYAGHLPTCRLKDPMSCAECDCGFAELMASLQKPNIC
jgi:hypothetical protein